MPIQERGPQVERDKRFMDLLLDDDTLHTPEGTMPLSEITRAEFVRDVVSDGPGPSTQRTSAPAVIGGAIVGGALLGTAGAIGGGLLGSTVKEEAAGPPRFHTASVKIVFETQSLVFSIDIPRDRETEAYNFVRAVQKAVKHQA